MEELVRQRDDLKKKLRELDNLAETGTEKILNAIKNQRWFFFENNKYILMDRDTSLLWTNLKYFPYIKKNNILYSSSAFSWHDELFLFNYSKKPYTEVISLVEKFNSEEFGGLNTWRIPTPGELWKMIEDKTFPFQSGTDREIAKYWVWCVDQNGVLAAKDLRKYGATVGIEKNSNVCVILCSNSRTGDNHFYTPKTFIRFTTYNKLIPIFDEEEITKLYEIIFYDKEPYRLIQFPKLLIEQYDVAAVNKSAINYFDAVLSLTDELLNVLQEYEASQSETIAEFLKITLNLGAKYTDNPNLTAEENVLLSERQQSLARRLEIGIDEPKRRILSVKAQAERFFERLDAINGGADSISELAELQARPRADFELLLENLARIIRDVQQRVDFFAEHKEFVSNLVKAHIGWSNDYKAFKTSLREELASICRKESIDDEVFASWYEDWRKKRLAIEQRFLPLVEFGLKGALSEEVSKILWFLGEYRDRIDKFYLHERKNIYQKFAFVPGGGLQEKFETESELYKLAEKFQRDLQGIIFACDKTEERIFLLRWAEPILNLPIDEISNFIHDKELDTIAEEVLTQLAELKRKNFAEYLADSKAYSDAAQKREKEFNALIFRMRKDLNKK